MRYLHTMLRVRKLDVALKFYQDALGLREVRRTDNEKGRFTLVFLCASEDLEALKKLPSSRLRSDVTPERAACAATRPLRAALPAANQREPVGAL